MAVLAPAPHVDDGVGAELLAELVGQLRDPRAGLGIAAVHVEDRYLDALRVAGDVLAGGAILEIGGEADLVVDDQVEGAADVVAGEPHHVEALGGGALAGERCVAVDDDGHMQQAVKVAVAVAARTRATESDRTHELEMRGVRAERDAHAAAVERGPVAAVSLVVLHVAAAVLEVGLPRFLEVRHHLLGLLPELIHHHAQAAAVRHADDEFRGAQARRQLDPRFHDERGALAALDAESLLADVAGREEVLERLRLHELLEQEPAPVLREHRAVAAGLHALREPRALGRVLDVHELDADAAAVRFLEALEDRRERAGVGQRQRAGIERLRQVRVIEAERVERQVGRVRACGAQRIELRSLMADLAETNDHRIDATLRLAHAGRRGGDRCGRRRGHRGGRRRLGRRGPGQAKVEAEEELSPAGIDRLRVALPRRVLLLEERWIPGVHRLGSLGGRVT